MTVTPRFEIEELQGKRKKTVAKPKVDDDGKLIGGFDYEEIEVDAGWMVYFPHGASIHIWTRSEMERQGFLKHAGLINLETGDAVEETKPVSLKEKSKQITASKSELVHHT